MEVVDFSKAEPSRNFRNKMLARYDRTINCLQEQRDACIAFHDQCEVYRKDRASIIEDVVKMLKSLDVKPSKPLGKFDHKGLVDELTRLINENPDKDMEAVEIALIKIKNRYRDITHMSKKLETFQRRLFTYPDEGYKANMEEDYPDELVIDLTAMKSQTNVDDNAQENDEMEMVVETHEASEDLVASLKEILNPSINSAAEIDINELTAPISLKEIELSTLQDGYSHDSEDENFANQIATLAEELKAGLDETNIVSFLSKDEEQVEDYAFTISNNISLQDLVKHVYEGTDDESYDSELWTSVYNFSTNKKVIDEVADRLGVSVEEVVKTPGMLNKITLRFPTELVTYEQVATEGTMRRAA